MRASKAELPPHCADVCLSRAGLSVQHCALVGDCQGTSKLRNYDLGGATVGFVQNCSNADNRGKPPSLRPRMNGDDSAVVYGKRLPRARKLEKLLGLLYKRFDE